MGFLFETKGKKMAFDGITIAAVTAELREKLLENRIYKIAQPEADELMLTIKGNSTQYRLLLSADATLPLIYLTDHNKTSPMNAPAFCMLLRKHLQNAKIVDITQPDMERIVVFTLEHLDEMGDLCRKKLIIELMGKHSNIIFCNEEDIILDSIKHISGIVSSVREVLPGKQYFIPKTQDKKNPFILYENDFISIKWNAQEPVYKEIYGMFTGISPIMAQEICHNINIDSDLTCNLITEEDKNKVLSELVRMMNIVRLHQFKPCVYYDGKYPSEFSCIPLTMYTNSTTKEYDSVSTLLQDYYEEKNKLTRIRQKSFDLRKIVSIALERNVKKYDLQLKQLKDSEKKDKYRIYGELLNTYGYTANAGDKEIRVINYYNNEEITIPLDSQMTPIENAKKYFDKYGKLKRTAEALNTLTMETKEEIDHLESIAASIDIAENEDDLKQIKEELTDSGFIKRKGQKKEKIKSKPFHYVSRDGFDIYVGKNNYQNDELTFHLATGNDWWFHAKGKPGSHVIIKTDNKEIPDTTFEDAARLAAFYSKGRDQDKTEIDYTQKKNVKKPSGAKPGFVVYYTNYSMMASTDIRDLTIKNS